jgi:DNA gyrase inhibitor GyrI
MKRFFLGKIFLFLAVSSHAQQVTISDSMSFEYVCMEFRGSLYQIQQNMRTLMQEAQKQELLPRMLSPIFVVQLYSHLQPEPTGSDWVLGFRIPDSVTVTPPLKKVKYEYDKVARMIYTGPYETTAQAFNTIIPYIDEEKLEIIGPPMQMYLDDPSQVPPESCRTEFLIPVSSLSTQTPRHQKYP